MDAEHIVDHMLEVAVSRRASDVHIQPLYSNSMIRFRIDGMLVEWRTCTKEEHVAILSRLKYIANMDIGETRLPQDGALFRAFPRTTLQLRLSTMPTVYGEKMVIRLFPQHHEHDSLASLGFSTVQYTQLHHFIHSPNGLLLVTGPTGSGKTTTLYQILNQLASDTTRNIVSLEDPVEMRLPTLTQSQINAEQGFTFGVGLRALLRQDPDVIFVGEIRDDETAEIAVRAALTGHLVLSTLHTSNCVGAIIRLLEMGVRPHYLASALIGVVAQRLYRLPCPYCQDGCYACFYQAYLGRRGVFELLPVTEDLQVGIRQQKSEKQLHTIVKQMKVMPLANRLLRLAAAGITTFEECMY